MFGWVGVVVFFVFVIMLDFCVWWVLNWFVVVGVMLFVVLIEFGGV